MVTDEAQPATDAPRRAEAPIFLDHGSTTPCDLRVVAAMLPYFSELPINPTGSVHPAARAIDEAIDEARGRVAALIGAARKEIIFTSGATEANNLAILGLARGANGGERRKIVTTAIEHKSVLAPCRDLGRQGFSLVELPVSRHGVVDLAAAEAAIDERTLLVSVQLANGEVGAIQPVAEVARLARARGAFVHCDAAQALGRIPVDVDALGVELLSVSAHKCYGPKGVGALYVRGGAYALPLRAQILGGGQERGLRSGTLNVPGIVGFGEACRIAGRLLPEEMVRLARLRDRFETELLARFEGVTINGAGTARLPGSTNVTLAGVDADALIVNMPDVVVGTGSACIAGAPEPSYVLMAMGLSGRTAYETVRVSCGRGTLEDEVLETVMALGRAFRNIRGMTLQAC